MTLNDGWIRGRGLGSLTFPSGFSQSRIINLSDDFSGDEISRTIRKEMSACDQSDERCCHNLKYGFDDVSKRVEGSIARDEHTSHLWRIRRPWRRYNAHNNTRHRLLQY